MAVPALATIEQLQTLHGATLTDDAQAQARLENASATVRAYAGTTWLDDAGDLLDVPDEVSGVVVQMVERTLQNPSGITQESAGPFSRSFGADAAQRLYLTANDKLVIRNAVGRTGIGTIATSRGYLETAGPCRYGDDTLPEECDPFSLST